MAPTALLLEKIQAIRSLTTIQVPRRAVEYRVPDFSLLNDYRMRGSVKNQIEPSVLEEKMAEFGLHGQVVNISRGPVISRYEVQLAKGVKLSQVRSVSEDLALALMSEHIRIQAPIPGTALVGIEVVNSKLGIIGLKSILSSKVDGKVLPLAIGVDTVGKPKTIDLTKMPHLLIAGQTGSGKSVCLNSIILSLMYYKKPDECQLVLVDPKRVEMASYRSIPHLRCPVVTDPEAALKAFEGLIEEMENRYRILEEHQVRNIESYNEVVAEKMPYIVCIVDEMADLMMCSGKELERMIVRLAQLARAVGIHLILATQKPVVSVITGLIKSNMPSRIAFQVASQSDSRVILDTNGAESLIGRFVMLITYPCVPDPVRFHGAWISDEEIKAIIGG